MQPKLKARRFAFIRQLDTEVGGHTAGDLTLDIERRNPDVKINDVIKIKAYTHVLKICFEETNIADKALTDSMLICKILITFGQIRR